MHWRSLMTVATVLLFLAPTWAQDAPPAPRPPQNLAEALVDTRWNAAERGPLLVVDPQRVQQKFGPGRAPVPVPVAPRGGYNLRELADTYDQIVVRAGALTVVAPATIKQLRRPDLSVEEAAGLSPEEALKRLALSLTPEQWTRFGTAQGLGAQDLSRPQRALFFAALPSPVSLMVPGSGDGRRILDDSQREQLRLNLVRTSQIWFLPEGTDGNHRIGFGQGEPVPGELPEIYLQSEGGSNNDLIQRLAPEVPNRLKPGDLAFSHASLNASIALEGASTVQDLVARAAQATRLELMVDARAGRLPVVVRGTSARAGDVLEGLCRSIGGAFRRLDDGPQTIFLLTEDRDGLGTRLAMIGELVSNVILRQFRSSESDIERLRAVGVRERIEIRDPYGIPESVRQKAVQQERLRQLGKASGEPGIAVTDLPAAAQTFVAKQLASHPTITIGRPDGTSQPTQIRSDRVSLNSELRLNLIVPGTGQAQLPNGYILTNLIARSDLKERGTDDEPAPDESVTLPSSWRQRGLHVRLQTPDDAVTAVRIAHESGFNALWVEVSLQAEAQDLLRAAVAAGKAQKIPVGAVVRLLRAPVDHVPAGLEPDLTLFGETSAQNARRLLARLGKDAAISPDTGSVVLTSEPSTFAALTAPLLGVARTPGLAGLILTDTAPPGYARRVGRGSGGDNTSGLGYTRTQRLDFLRAESADPIDLPATSSWSDSRVMPPAFSEQVRYIPGPDGVYRPDPKASLNLDVRWNAFRATKNEAGMRALYGRLRAGNPTLPLWVAAREGMGSGTSASWIGSWDRADALPSLPSWPENDGQAIAAARASSMRVLTSASLWDNATPQALRSMLGYLASNRGATDGIVLNLTALPVEKLAPFLQALWEKTRP